MRYDPDVVTLKEELLDRIRQHPELLRAVAERLAGAPAELAPCPRPWLPGGGATVFQVRTADAAWALKVKATRLRVESRLECEPGFSATPALEAEYAMITRLQGFRVPWVPARARFAREGGFDFLLTEYLDDFNQRCLGYGLPDWLDAFRQLEAAARWLHGHGIVHTDLHEFNVRVRPATGELVLVDFEEARDLLQAVPFRDSLDWIGRNRYGELGPVPATGEGVEGPSCLERLHRLFCRRMLPQALDLAGRCRFDSACPFLATLDHGADPRAYQSLDLGPVRLEGQRPLADPRPAQVLELIGRTFPEPVVHLDIGCNLGGFSLALAGHPRVRRSIGVDAFPDYVAMARVQAFYRQCAGAEFLQAECGADALAERIGEPVDVVTLYSVFHHIRRPEAFLADLARLRPKLVLGEWATQPEAYGGRDWRDVLGECQARLGLPCLLSLGASADYRRPLILLAAAPRYLPGGGAAPAAAGPAPPRVSVVLPTHDHLAHLPAAVAAVLGQTWREFELIVVDDGSTDGTPEWLEGIADPRVRVLRQPHRGLPAALNAGFQAARGDCLTWTSADNLPHPAMLERLLAALEARPEAGMVVAGHLLIDARDRILRVHRDQDATPLSLVGANPGIAAFLYRRGLAAVRAGYDPELDGAEDWDLWLRIAEEAPISVLPEILYSYRLHPDSMTATRGERIAAASRGVVARALARHGGTLPPEVYLPGRAVPGAPPPELGRAYWDLARRMHRSPFAPKDLALRLFREAAARLRDPDLCHGMFLAALRAWDPAAIAGSLQDLALAGDPARAGRLTAGVRAGRLEEADLVLPEPLHHPGA